MMVTQNCVSFALLSRQKRINYFENPVHKTRVNIISHRDLQPEYKIHSDLGSAKEMMVNQNCVSFPLLSRQKCINGFENPVHKK
jgi:hypothetical protein